MFRYKLFSIALFAVALCHRGVLCKPSIAAKCVSEHNVARKQYGASPVSWDSTLAAHAQAWADKLNSGTLPPGVVHDYRTREGENIAYLSKPTCKEAVEYWVEEVIDYKDLGYCKRPARYAPVSYVLHFTQVVWKATRKIGVGISGHWIVTRYSPSGNVPRHFAKNVQC